MEFNFLIRFLACMLLIASILFMPFGVSMILALAGMVYFSLFFEPVLAFFLSDLLYGVAEGKYFGIYFTLLSILFLIIVELLKKRLKFYP